MGDTRENKTNLSRENTNRTRRPSHRGATNKGEETIPGSVVRGRPVVKNSKETHQEQERRDPWRTGIGRRRILGYYQLTEIVRGNTKGDLGVIVK